MFVVLQTVGGCPRGWVAAACEDHSIERGNESPCRKGTHEFKWSKKSSIVVNYVVNMLKDEVGQIESSNLSLN